MLIGSHEIANRLGRWYADNVFRNGEIAPGEYVLLRRDAPIDTQIAWGHDPYELLKIADVLNEREKKKEAA